MKKCLCLDKRTFQTGRFRLTYIPTPCVKID